MKRATIFYNGKKYGVIEDRYKDGGSISIRIDDLNIEFVQDFRIKSKQQGVDGTWYLGHPDSTKVNSIPMQEWDEYTSLLWSISYGALRDVDR